MAPAMSSARPPGQTCMSTSTVSTHHLDVPGARIYYEVRGAGPLLLVLGQPMTSGPFAPLADLLAQDHTVMTYDPRGLGQSSVADPAQAVTPEDEADDLAEVVRQLDAGPADVFGSSGGAVAGLALASRHPELVRTLVAHEPPVTELLPDAAQIRAAVDAIEAAYVEGGAGAAWAGFVSLVMHRGAVPEAGPEPATWPPPGGAPATDDQESTAAPAGPTAKQLADDELFFLRMLKPFTRYEPDLATLGSGQPRVMVAVGSASAGEIAARSAQALADRLGVETTAFPGDHGGFMADPHGFAHVIRRVLGEA